MGSLPARASGARARNLRCAAELKLQPAQPDEETRTRTNRVPEDQLAPPEPSLSLYAVEAMERERAERGDAERHAASRREYGGWYPVARSSATELSDLQPRAGLKENRPIVAARFPGFVWFLQRCAQDVPASCDGRNPPAARRFGCSVPERAEPPGTAHRSASTPRPYRWRADRWRQDPTDVMGDGVELTLGSRRVAARVKGATLGRAAERDGVCERYLCEFRTRRHLRTFQCSQGLSRRRPSASNASTRTTSMRPLNSRLGTMSAASSSSCSDPETRMLDSG